MQSTSKAKSVAAVVSFFAAACAGSNAATLEYGECADVFGGRVCTWGVTQGSEVTEFGVTVPMLSVEGAPAHGEIPWPPVEIASLRLPQSVTAQTGFDHLKLYWEHHGHPPGPYLYPHFDFHFYNMGPERVTAIDCDDTQKPTRLRWDTPCRTWRSQLWVYYRDCVFPPWECMLSPDRNCRAAGPSRPRWSSATMRENRSL